MMDDEGGGGGGGGGGVCKLDGEGATAEIKESKESKGREVNDVETGPLISQAGADADSAGVGGSGNGNGGGDGKGSSGESKDSGGGMKAVKTGADFEKNFEKIDPSHHSTLFVRHLQAMITKRALYFLRDRRSVVFVYVIPVVFVLAGMLVMKVSGWVGMGMGLGLGVWCMVW